ncbi:MAG: xanthine dehydrogenase, partial [Acidimicrobiaceae bacterium]|nr:xanthine dehydrogenase [Acidimicrobiaceae bacterium]
MTIDVTFELNGAPVTLAVEPHHTLREALRRLGMFSVHFGSDSGETGAAAVLYDGRLASADVILAASADGHRVTTVESLNVSPDLHPVQTAFVAVGAFQSGYSAGAMILGTLALLEENSDPSEDEIRDMLSGILDRETAFVKPVEAVKRAAAVMRGAETEPFAPLVIESLTDGSRPPAEPPTASPAPE